VASSPEDWGNPPPPAALRGVVVAYGMKEALWLDLRGRHRWVVIRGVVDTMWLGLRGRHRWVVMRGVVDTMWLGLRGRHRWVVTLGIKEHAPWQTSGAGWYCTLECTGRADQS
jgi:hypothetical protein